MKNRKIISAAAVLFLWLALCVAAWCKPATDISQAERRKLAQFPSLSASRVLSGKFMADFESYTLDQFPMRDSFRQLKAAFHYYGLRQGDNNGIYLADGYAAKLEYPLNETSVSYAMNHVEHIYRQYLQSTDSDIYFSIVPDKSFYLAKENGYPAMDYAALFRMVQEATPWAAFVDITDCLTLPDYYRTDTHWRQERLLPVARKLADAMDVSVGEVTPSAVDRPFYGVYYGQAALPMAAETMYTMESDWLDDCTVYHPETGQTTAVYDRSKLSGRDMYDVYLSGAVPLLTITNPHGRAGKELIVFRDSFASALIPLLIEDYQTITLVDTRYIPSDHLGDYISFHGQDVLFLYSTLILNSSSTLK